MTHSRSLPSPFARSERELSAGDKRKQESGPISIGPSSISFSVPPTAAPVHVLVVEDNADCRRFIVQVLLHAGYRVDVAEDGVEALLKTTATTYDMIVTDLDMPRMNGLDAAREIRRNERLRNRPRVPIIAVTAHYDPDIQVLTKDAGMDEVQAKPIRSRALLESLNKYRKVPAEVPKNSIVPQVAGTPAVEIDEDIAALVPTFLANVERDVIDLRTALADNDFDVIRRIGHNLKGSGGSFGFPKLSEIGARIEASGKMLDSPSAELRIEELATHMICYK